MIYPNYTVEDMQRLCECYDNFVYDIAYSRLIAGDNSVPSISMLRDFNRSCSRNVFGFLSYLKKEYGTLQPYYYGLKFYRSLILPFDRIPVHLGENSILKEILECRLEIGK